LRRAKRRASAKIRGDPVSVMLASVVRTRAGSASRSRPRFPDQAAATRSRTSAPPEIWSPFRIGGRLRIAGASSMKQASASASIPRVRTTEAATAPTGTPSRAERSWTRAVSPRSATESEFIAEPTKFASWTARHRQGAEDRSRKYHANPLAIRETRFTARAAQRIPGSARRRTPGTSRQGTL